MTINHLYLRKQGLACMCFCGWTRWYWWKWWSLSSSSPPPPPKPTSSSWSSSSSFRYFEFCFKNVFIWTPALIFQWGMYLISCCLEQWGIDITEHQQGRFRPSLSSSSSSLSSFSYFEFRHKIMLMWSPALFFLRGIYLWVVSNGEVYIYIIKYK